MTRQDAALTIDVVSDVVCPWCYLGKKRLERALAAEPGEPLAVRWRPYQLDPAIPAEGLERRAYMARKFGDDGRIEAAHRRLEALGAEEGIAFAFDRIARAPNTLDAHRLIRWAFLAGAQNAMVDRLFALYFEQGRDIGDRRLLIETAGACGMDEALVARLFAEGADEREVRAEIAEAQSLGVTGVPFFIFAQRFGVPGAQSAEVLSTAIERARKSLAGVELA
ncbi:MAG: DsbA family oxidoreductase [Roseiarcus sp.]|jgi:predicted DsbA family dithiol-disulfide isomerase